MNIRLLYIYILTAGILISCQKNDPIIHGTESCVGDDVPNYNTNHPLGGSLQDMMTQLVNKGVPGVSLLIRNADGLWIGAIGQSDLKGQQALQECNIMRIASITKPMVVSTALHLYDEGLIDIDVPISTYLDHEISENVANARIATLRQCMDHSSGIYDHVESLDFQTEVLNNPTKKWTEQELVKFAYDKEAYFSPGTSTHYSNINTVLVALCINKVLGYYHGIEMRQFLFGPLGMLSTFYYSHEDIRPETTRGYFDLYDRGTLVDVSNFNTGIAHTAVYSTVYDLEKFLRSLLIDQTLLGDTTLDQMQVWKPNSPDTEFGLGLMRRKMGHSNDWSRAGIGHTGGEFGYSGKCFYYPYADVTIISLCNYGTNIQSDIGDLYHQFHREVERLLMP